MGKNRSVAMVLGCFGSVLIFGCVELQRCLAWVDLSHLSPCCQVLSSLGVYGWQKKAWQKWQSHYTSNYMLVWASAEGVTVESVHLKDHVDSECVGSSQVGSLCFETLSTLWSWRKGKQRKLATESPLVVTWCQCLEWKDFLRKPTSDAFLHSW